MPCDAPHGHVTILYRHATTKYTQSIQYSIHRIAYRELSMYYGYASLTHIPESNRQLTIVSRDPTDAKRPSTITYHISHH